MIGNVLPIIVYICLNFSLIYLFHVIGTFFNVTITTHNIEGLAQAMGGTDIFEAKLDSMFSENRYWHGNEPCHQIAYLFNYTQHPWKTQREVRHIMETEYKDHPGGLSGNDDAGLGRRCLS